MTTESLSLLEQKYAKRFDMLDVDSSGTITGEDFELLAGRLVAGLGVTPGSPKARRVHDGYQELWTSLRRVVDENGDGEISRAEFVHGMNQLAGDGPGFKRMIEPLARLNLSLCDADGDGNLNETEFGTLLGLFNANSAAEAADIFRKLDTSGDGFLSLEEILEALHQFYVSTDPAAPGNRLFGKV